MEANHSPSWSIGKQCSHFYTELPVFQAVYQVLNIFLAINIKYFFAKDYTKGFKMWGTCVNVFYLFYSLLQSLTQ